MDNEEEYPFDLGEIIQSLSDHTTDSERPFSGQSHTYQGERGKTEVKGIRFRDLADCVARAFIGAAVFTIKDKTFQEELRDRAEDGTLNYNDLYSLDLSEMDPGALISNIICEVEKMMGIYPNIPKIDKED